MFEILELKSLLIVGAVGAYVLGFLFRDQIYIRLLVVVGSLFYIYYYGIAGPTPLWDAIIGSALIGLASLQGVFRLWWSRMSFAIPRNTHHIYGIIGDIEPGLFRQLIKAARHLDIQTTTILVREGQHAESLWYLVSGEVLLERKGQETTRISKPGFVGEIAWLTKGPASATVIADEGVEVLHWDAEELRKAARRSTRLELSLESLIAQDLAKKLSKSRPINERSALSAH